MYDDELSLSRHAMDPDEIDSCIMREMVKWWDSYRRKVDPQACTCNMDVLFACGQTPPTISGRLHPEV